MLYGIDHLQELLLLHWVLLCMSSLTKHLLKNRYSSAERKLEQLKCTLVCNPQFLRHTSSHSKREHHQYPQQLDAKSETSSEPTIQCLSQPRFPGSFPTCSIPPTVHTTRQSYIVIITHPVIPQLSSNLNSSHNPCINPTYPHLFNSVHGLPYFGDAPGEGQYLSFGPVPELLRFQHQPFLQQHMPELVQIIPVLIPQITGLPISSSWCWLTLFHTQIQECPQIQWDW